MAQIYSTVGAYLYATRVRLQDLVFPYRYSDPQVIASFNSAISDAQRMRPDMFLDLKYQQPLIKGDIGDGFPDAYYTLNDLVYVDPPDNTTVNPLLGTYTPIPSKYNDAIVWYMSGHLQLYDVNDTQDQRAQAFLTKFQQQLLSVAT
jgi:hypothetical protein